MDDLELLNALSFSIRWVLDERANSTLPNWVLPAFLAPVIVGGILGWAFTSNVVGVLLFAILGLIPASLGLVYYVKWKQEPRVSYEKGDKFDMILDVLGTPVPHRPNDYDFQRELDRIFLDAQEQHLSQIEVLSGDLHRELGTYPGSLPLCCDVMQRNVRSGDEILDALPKGHGATLKIRYRIPR
jgi:hypothetical protein